MAAYGDVGSTGGAFPAVGWTDVNYYVRGISNYIDFYQGNAADDGVRIDYVLYLQKWDTTINMWRNVNTVHKGYFRYGVTKRWTINGQPTGAHRIRGVYTKAGGSAKVQVTPVFSYYYDNPKG